LEKAVCNYFEGSMQTAPDLVVFRLHQLFSTSSYFLAEFAYKTGAAFDTLLTVKSGKYKNATCQKCNLPKMRKNGGKCEKMSRAAKSVEGEDNEGGGSWRRYGDQAEMKPYAYTYIISRLCSG